MKETLSLLVATVVILTLSISSFKSIPAAADTKPTLKVNIEDAKAAALDHETSSDDSYDSADNTASEAAADNSSAESEPAESTAQSTQEESQQSTPAPAPAPAPTPAAPTPSTGNENNLTSAQRINAATLNPQYTPYAELNNKINEILSQIITPGMSNYQKIRACYDYIVYNCSEGYITGTYSPRFGGWTQYAQAMALFTERRGMCDCYSAGFAVLARAVGLNCYQYSGRLRYAAGYIDDHDWVEANINGTLYVFDPDVEDDMSGGGTEYRFCKTYGELSGEYFR